ncbi:Trypsin-like peptidase domain-containing protein [Geodermatophilus pulveris]|uniref:Trypsin-like peptidase domain-containing protein n=1 Tax=Geodermatophilus pulveris TaxID=1564159 RepID=A0A239DS09_9ACTN|nr:serine protease [Geodermatophilus pulveris]SNS35270.1 Trypsin-like peptidase domain-containing protein [Geodermatophilus pulveris]
MTTSSRRSAARRTLTTAAALGVAAGTLIVAAPGTALAAEGPASASVGAAERSIVSLTVEWEGFVRYPTSSGQWRWSAPIALTGSCTGWFASGQGHVVTAGHCLDPAEVEDDVRAAFLAERGLDLDPSRLDWPVEGRGESTVPDLTRVWVSQPPVLEGAVLEDALVAQVVDWQPEADGDLALLKVNNLPEPTPALTVAADPPSVGDEVTAIGYPGHVGGVSDPARLRASFKTGTVSSTQVTHEGVARTEVNADMAQGMSGGPTVDARGAVVGVVSAGFADQAFNFMTDHAALVAFLDHHDVEASGTGASGALTADPGLAVQGRTAPAGEFPVTSLVAAGGVALALAGGGTFLAGRRRPATAPASAAAAPADPTRFVGRPAWMTPGGARGPACAHSGSAPGSGYCGDCGTRLTRGD